MSETVLTGRPAARGRSLTDDAIARLLANRAATASLAVLALLTLFALLGPALTPWPGTFWRAWPWDCGSPCRSAWWPPSSRS